MATDWSTWLYNVYIFCNWNCSFLFVEFPSACFWIAFLLEFIAGIPQLVGFAFFVTGIPFKIFSLCYFYCWNFFHDSLRLHSVAGISRATQFLVPGISFKTLSKIPTSPIFVSSGLIKHLHKYLLTYLRSNAIRSYLRSYDNFQTLYRLIHALYLIYVCIERQT